MKTPTKDGRKDTRVPADYFATTHWSVVINAGQGGSPQAEVALNELCRRYWYPLYAFARRQGAAHAEAEDLVQGFFAGFLKKNYLAPLRKENGRFRQLSRRRRWRMRRMTWCPCALTRLIWCMPLPRRRNPSIRPGL